MVEMVSVELPDPVTEVGLKDPVVRFGNPLRVRFTVNPEDPVTVTVEEIFEPRFTVTVAGETEIAKSATTSVTGVECTRAPLVAVIVRG